MPQKQNYRHLLLPLVSLLFIFTASLYKIQDSDFWIHLASGRYNLNWGTILKQDVFTFSQYGYFWCNHEWGYQILLYLTYLLTGFKGIVIVNALFITTIFFLIYKSLAVKNQEEAIYAWSLIILAASISIPRLTVRPHIFSLFFTVTYLYILQNYVSGKIKHPFYLVIFQIFWVNLHGGTIFLGYFYAGVFWLESIVHYFTNQSEEKKAVVKKIIYQLTICLILLVLVSLINPYTYHIFTFPFLVRQQAYQVASIAEWQPLSLDFIRIPLSLLYLLTLLALPYSFLEKRWGILVITLCFAFLTIKHIRFFVEFSVVSIWLLYYFLKQFPLQTKKKKLVKKVLLTILFIVVLSEMMIALRNNISTGVGIAWQCFPQNASNFIKRYLPRRKIINPYEWGGFLMWQLPENLIFIDGRQFPPEEKTFKECDLIYGYDFSSAQRDTLMGVLQQNQADLVIYNELHPQAAQVFTPDLWALVYFDHLCQIYLPRLPKNKSTLEQFEYKIVNPLDTKMNFYSQALLDKTSAQQMIQELKRAATDDSQNSFVLALLARYYLDRQNWLTAVEILQKLVVIQPDSAKFWLELAKAQKHLGKIAQANTSLAKAKKLKSK